jgi:hypothetical protein
MEQNNEKNSATGNNQSSFAGTNTNRYGAPENMDEQNNPIEDAEAQNVIDGSERISGEEADRARLKATEGMRQGRDH